MKKSIGKHNKRFLSELIQKLEKVKRFDQTEGNYKDNCSSCVASHIAYHFFGHINYEFGMQGFFKVFSDHDGWTDKEVERTLRLCGAPKEPFGADRWPIHPAEVFRKFLELGRPVIL